MLTQSIKTVIIDPSWIEASRQSTINNTVFNLVQQGKTVAGNDVSIFVNETSNLPMVGFSDDADLYSICYKESKWICCSFTGGSPVQSIQELGNWIEKQNTPTSQMAQNTGPENAVINSNYAQWGTELLCESYKYCNGYGWLNINTSYFPLNENNVSYNYYYTKYNIQTVPDNNRRTSEVGVYSKLFQGHKILDYAPTTSAGTTTVGVNIGVNSDGVVSAGVSWSYSISDVIVVDSTNYGTREFSLNHELDIGKSVAKNTYTVKPGKVVRVDCNDFTKTGNYVATDKYTVEFCKRETGWLGLHPSWVYNTFEQNIGVICKSNPHTLTVMHNGADGFMYWDEDPTYDITIPDVYTVSDGGHVTLYDVDVTKTGHRLAGFSTSLNSGVIQYHVGDVLTMRNDMTLYLVWEAEQ